MTKEADCGGWRVSHRYAQTQLPADMATLCAGTRPSSGGSPIRCRRWRVLWPCLRAGPCDVGCAPASALTAAEASPVVAPLRLLDGFVGNGGRFRHGSWTSVRFPVGVVRCRLRRPGETLACCGVSGRFALRNRPVVASGVRLRWRWRILTCVSVWLVLGASIAIAKSAIAHS